MLTVRESLGETFVIVDDPDGEQQLTADEVVRLAQGHAGLIRIVRCDAIAEGASGVVADPPAEWFFDYRLPDGSLGRFSATGLRVMARHLVDRGFVAQADRRETITIGTRAGVRDVLIGVAGVAVDLGRWRLIEDGERSMRIEIGGVAVHATITAAVQPNDSAETAVVDRASDVRVLVDAATITETRGIGEAGARAWKHHEADATSSGIGAAAAAILARHATEVLRGVHHWRITTPTGELGVRLFPTEDGEHVSVSGP